MTWRHITRPYQLSAILDEEVHPSVAEILGQLDVLPEELRVQIIDEEQALGVLAGGSLRNSTQLRPKYV
jgi:hypothetical protein